MAISSLKSLLDEAINKGRKQNAAIVAAEDTSVIKAALQAKKMGLIAPFFIGNKSEILKISVKYSLEIPDYEIIDLDNPAEAARCAVGGIRNGQFDIIIKGQIQTKDLLGEVVRGETKANKSNLLSHLSIFELPKFPRLLGITDAAMNIAPDNEAKEKIIYNAVEAFHKIGYALPKVALLAATETVNPKINATLEADYIVQKHHNSPIARCEVAGPLALDCALSVKAAQKKGLTGPVAGKADILIVPEINAGNILYKSLIYLSGAEVAGVVLGAMCPIILTSRADSAKSKLYSIALAICLC